MIWPNNRRHIGPIGHIVIQNHRLNHSKLRLCKLSGSSLSMFFKEGSTHSASAKPSLPSTFSRALGKEVCRVLPRRLCRVLEALGKALKTLGKGFAECRTRQRRLGTHCIGKVFFAKYFLSDTRQRGLPSAREHSKKSSRYGDG
jgi:hypothetical protein